MNSSNAVATDNRRLDRSDKLARKFIACNKFYANIYREGVKKKLKEGISQVLHKLPMKGSGIKSIKIIEGADASKQKNSREDEEGDRRKSSEEEKFDTNKSAKEKHTGSSEEKRKQERIARWGKDWGRNDPSDGESDVDKKKFRDKSSSESREEEEEGEDKGEGEAAAVPSEFIGERMRGGGGGIGVDHKDDRGDAGNKRNRIESQEHDLGSAGVITTEGNSDEGEERSTTKSGRAYHAKDRTLLHAQLASMEMRRSDV